MLGSLWDGLPQAPGCLDPLLDGGVYCLERLAAGSSIPAATREFGHPRHKALVGRSPGERHGVMILDRHAVLNEVPRANGAPRTWLRPRNEATCFIRPGTFMKRHANGD